MHLPYLPAPLSLLTLAVSPPLAVRYSFLVFVL